jgi:ribosomal protein S18 acetylase RimI-like enzyme
MQRGGLFHREVEAFAVAGASSEHGYLQRLSVDPTRQRHGHGRHLTIDALGWMVRRGLPDCLVNTSVNNVAALALYDSVGFQPMRDRLRVLQYDVRQSL